MDVIRAAAVALCSGSSDSTQKFISTGDLRMSLRRDGRAAEGADLAGVVRRSEADERSSDPAAAIVACRDIRQETGVPVTLRCGGNAVIIPNKRNRSIRVAHFR